MTSFRFKKNTEDGNSGILTFSRHDESKDAGHFLEAIVGGEEMSHSAVRVKSEAKSRLRGDPIEEIKESKWL